MLRTRSMWVPAIGIVSLCFMAESRSIVDMYHFFLTHSSLDGNFVGFRVFGLVTGDAVQFWMHVPF